jgi:hypothetical protein
MKVGESFVCGLESERSFRRGLQSGMGASFQNWQAKKLSFGFLI